jgi:hypothetical protein
LALGEFLLERRCPASSSFRRAVQAGCFLERRERFSFRRVHLAMSFTLYFNRRFMLPVKVFDLACASGLKKAG